METLDKKSRHKKNRVLIVDDQAVNVEWMKKMVSEWGYEVITCHRGIEAIKKSRSEKPDLILLDVMMPDLTGYEVCRALKVHPVTTDIPVIFITAKGEIFDRIEGLDMGAHDYITKPFHPEELKIRMKTALARKEEKEQLKIEADELKSQLLIDKLTGFYNRRYLEERLSEELARAQRYYYSISLVLLSPAEFSEIKRVFGSEKVNSFIRQIGEIIKFNIRAIDIVARYSENCFAIMLPQTDQQGAAVFGEKIIKITNNHTFKGISEKKKIRMDLGIATFEEFSMGNMNTIIKEAEKALKESKSQKKVIIFEI